MSFFLRKGRPGAAGANSKRKNAPVGGSSRKAKTGGGKPKKFRREEEDDEEIPSDDSDLDKNVGEEDDGDRDGDDVGYGSGEMAETAEEKRARMARAYLEEIEKEERERAADAEELHEAVNARLRKDNLEEVGKLKREVAKLFLPVDVTKIRRLKDKKCTKLSVTCLAATPDGRSVYVGSKDGGLTCWDLRTWEKRARRPGGKRGQEESHHGHCSTVNAVAVSSDGKYVATGDDGRRILVWDAHSLQLLKTFKGHKDSVTGLAFRRKTHTLYSCSADRSVKIWSLDEMAYVETLFGHQDRVTGIDAGLRERAVTSGGRDGSVRIWKIVEESQLVFNGPAVSVDAVRLVNEEHFVTAGEDGHISLWGVMKKKPLCTVHRAHGVDSSSGAPNWVSAVTCLPMSDLVASGSCDGQIRLWQCGEHFRRLSPLLTVPAPGFVNGLAFAPSAGGGTEWVLLAALGQEHRLGRWTRDREAKNCVLVIPLETTEKIN